MMTIPIDRSMELLELEHVETLLQNFAAKTINVQVQVGSCAQRFQYDIVVLSERPSERSQIAALLHVLASREFLLLGKPTGYTRVHQDFDLAVGAKAPTLFRWVSAQWMEDFDSQYK